MQTRALVGALALLTLWPLSALAKPVAEIRGGSVLFYNDSLAIVVRNGVTAQLANGMRISATTAYVDLRTDRAVFAGNVEIVRGTATLRADALALDLPGRKIDVLRNGAGIMQTDAALTALQAAPGDGSAFAFPDLADGREYIRARRAVIVSRTSVRFRPAAFPTSAGAPPVPMYLYTFAAGNGYAATALSSAAFDQPYGLVSTPNALTALHLRYLNGIRRSASSRTSSTTTTGFWRGRSTCRCMRRSTMASTAIAVWARMAPSRSERRPTTASIRRRSASRRRSARS